MSKTFTLDEVHDLELSAADNATILERERIIALLEAHAETYLTTKEAIERELCEDWHTGITDAIALIKGEN